MDGLYGWTIWRTRWTKGQISPSGGQLQLMSRALIQALKLRNKSIELGINGGNLEPAANRWVSRKWAGL